MPRTSKAPPRRRLEAAAARELILDAAEKRLASVGPSGIRLQEVAADAGLSHPTLLHHFGSREQLVKAVISRALVAIDTALVTAIASSQGIESELETVLDNIGKSFAESGHARVLLWLFLEGHSIEDSKLGDVVDAAHALRLSRATGGEAPPRDDTARLVVLGAMALAAGSIMGPTLFQNTGIGDAPEEASRFRRWLARVLVGHFRGPGG